MLSEDIFAVDNSCDIDNHCIHYEDGGQCCECDKYALEKRVDMSKRDDDVVGMVISGNSGE
mgnify:FL=1